MPMPVPMPTTAPTRVPDAFEALRTHRTDGRVESRLERLRLADLSAGEVVVRTRWAGVNYKDCLSLLGKAKIVSAFPRVAGIELVGTVLASEAPGVDVGADVLVHGFQTGIDTDGAFSEIVRVPAAHVHPLPAGLAPREVAVLGVPAFTAAMALERFAELGLAPASGAVAVSGAGGAVGLLALALLKRAGWTAVALTRRPGQAEALRALGAADVLDAALAAGPGRPLETARFAAAIDNVGGPVLAWLLRSMQDRGVVASVGNAAGNAYEGSVLPFIVRRVQLFGVVANAPWEQRRRLWARLGSDWKPDLAAIEPHVREIRLGDLLAHAERQLAGQTSGRVLVAFDGA
jgi:acrylyl-CoA reductase (NADPH)